MPELPEVEVLRRDLEKEVVGRRVKDAEVRPGRNPMQIIRRHGRRKEFEGMVEGGKVESVDRVGKLLVLQLDNGHVLGFDLGMTGQLLKCSASEEMAPHTHIVFGFTIGGQLRVVDPKRTGEVFVISDADAEELRASVPKTIDPLARQVTWHELSGLLDQRDLTMKALMTDDGFICGLGDIYSDEVLFAAGLRYDRAANRLSSQDVRRLYRGLLETLQDAVRLRGTTRGDHGFRDLYGAPGQYQDELKVFEREGEPCRRCRSAVIKEEYGDGFTYLCAQCQS